MAPRNTQQSRPWDPITQPVDRIKLSGVWSPGIAEITGASSPRKWNEIDSAGWSGGIVVYQGIRMSHFTVRLSLYDLADWTGWQAFKPLVMRAPIGKRPRTHAIWHPQLAEVGISAAVVADVKAPVQTDHGVWLVELPMIEARLPKRGAPVRPDGAAEQTADDWREREIKRRTKLRDRLAQEGDELQ